MSTAVRLASFLSLSCIVAASVVPQIRYTELDYTFTHRGNTTTLTGVRSVNDSTTQVYMSGFTWINLEYTDGKKTNYGAFVYRGEVTGGGEWYGNFNFPSTDTATVSGTFFYGPCSGSASGIKNLADENNFVQVVGDYETVQGGGTQYGLLYQGYLNGTGEWRTLDPSPLLGDNPFNTVFGTIGHSTMGGLAVGNFNTDDAPNKFRAFVYDIARDSYDELVYTNANGEIHVEYSITAYCIWHNQGTEMYSIAGGIGKAGAEDGFIVNYNATSRNATDWRFFHHANSTITHFQGMWPDFANQGVGYSFSANWVSLITKARGTSFVYVSDINSPDRSTNNVNWYDYHFPGTINNSANSVYYNTTIAFFETTNQIYAHGFVAQFCFSNCPSSGDSGNDPLLSQAGVIAVSVVGAVVGLAALGYVGYMFSAKSAGAAQGGAGNAATGGAGGATARSTATGVVNPITGSIHSGIALSETSESF